jgi:hypothetical protein
MNHVSYITKIDLSKGSHGKYVELHKVTMDGYAEVRSSNAFFYNDRKMKRDRKLGFMWMSRNEESHLMELEVAREFATKTPLWDRLPIIEHESIWAFYDHIGYDYKTKKYKE